jgi:hypothetical protein
VISWDGHRREDEYDSYPFPKLPSLSHTVLVYHKLSLLLSLSPSYQVRPCDTLPEILGDNVSAKHNDILFELLLYPYNHNTSESTLWQATGNSQVKNPSFSVKIIQKNKSPSANAKGLGMS